MEKEVTCANPATAGIVALCTVVIPLAVLNLGWIPPQSAPLLIGWLLFGGLVQVIAGIIGFKKGASFCYPSLSIWPYAPYYQE